MLKSVGMIKSRFKKITQNRFIKNYSEKLSGMKIKKKLMISFIVVIFIAILSSVIGMLFLVYNNNKAKHTLVYYGFSQGDIGRINAEFQRGGNFIRDRVNETDALKITDLDTEIMKSEIQIDKYMGKVSESIVDNDLKDIFSEIQNDLKQYRDVRVEVLNLAKVNRNDEAYELFSKEGTQLATAVGDEIEKLFELNVSKGNNQLNKMRWLELTAIAVTLVVTAIAITISMIIAKKIVEGISTPISLLVDTAEKMSNGDLNIKIEYSSENEIGILAKTFSKTIENIKEYIRELSSVLNSVSQGKLDVEIGGDYKGDFIKIKQSLDNIIFSLNGVFNNINQSANDVAVGSEQMELGSLEISQASIEQASAIEELSASINEISEQISKSAENAINARKITDMAAIECRNGNKQVEKMIKSMCEIEQSSKQISKVIKTINDIANQTSILSLNASIEAARAGEAGKGFEVVAKEVGKLAQKSSEEVKNTSKLIENSIKAVENGIKIAEETGKALLLIVDETEKSTQFVNEIAQASNNQANSITQITEVVEQIACVVQKNSVTAEESAEKSVQLSNQSRKLKEFISNFRLKE